MMNLYSFMHILLCHCVTCVFKITDEFEIKTNVESLNKKNCLYYWSRET